MLNNFSKNIHLFSFLKSFMVIHSSWIHLINSYMHENRFQFMIPLFPHVITPPFFYSTRRIWLLLYAINIDILSQGSAYWLNQIWPDELERGNSIYTIIKHWYLLNSQITKSNIIDFPITTMKYCINPI